MNCARNYAALVLLRPTRPDTVMVELPSKLTPVDPEDLATVLFALVRDISEDPRLVAVLVGQSALETGNWTMVRHFNLGNTKASDDWIESGGDFTYYTEVPPHANAPVTETLTEAQVRANLALARPRPDGDGLDMFVAREQPGHRFVCEFWPRHVQARFRAYRSLYDGAESWVAMLRRKYGPALDRAAQGDVVGYCRELRRLGPYFTADINAYTKLVANRYRKFLPVAQAVAEKALRPSIDGAEEREIMPRNENPYRTRTEHLGIHPSSWWPLSSGVEITCLPVVDTGGRGPLFARGSETVRKWAEQQGWRLASDDSYRELHRICGKDGPGIHIDPYPLPDAALLREHGVPRTREALQRFLWANMASQEWCTRHDVEVMTRLDVAGWDGCSPVDNAGKHIDADGDIIGWERHDGDLEWSWIQSESAAHRGHEQLDYATLVHLERDVDADSTPTPEPITKRETPASLRRDDLLSPDSEPATIPRPASTELGDIGDAVRAWQQYLLAFFADRGEQALPRYGADAHHGTETERWTQRWRALTRPEEVVGDAWLAGFAEAGIDPAQLPLGLRCLAWIGYQRGLGVREIPGPRHDARIVAYSQHARRGGRFLGVDDAGVPIWDGGISVALGTDEAFWCAAGQSAAMTACLRAGESPPHGLRVAVWEIVEDARAVGLLHVLGDGYIPKPGDLAIEARGGQTPLRRGTGHVRRVVLVQGERYFGLGGNESNTWGAGWHAISGDLRPDGHQLVAWVEYP